MQLEIVFFSKRQCAKNRIPLHFQRIKLLKLTNKSLKILHNSDIFKILKIVATVKNFLFEKTFQITIELPNLFISGTTFVV